MGIPLRLGGGASETGDRFGSGPRDGGGIREFIERKGGWTVGNVLRRGGTRPPEARWIEF